MEETVTIIGNTCLKHHDSGEASVNREARLIIEALREKGYEIILMPKVEVTEKDFLELVDNDLPANFVSANCFNLAQKMVLQNEDKWQEFHDKRIKETREEYKIQQTAHPIGDKPFATWLRINNYFKSKKGEKKIYENKFIEGFFTRKGLYKKFKTENSKQVEKKEGEVNIDWKEKYEIAIKQKINYSKEVDRLREKYEPKGFANEYKGA